MGTDGASSSGESAVDQLMDWAIVLGERARRRSAPNPWVGCVLVRDGMIVGEGASEAPGGPHAETAALAAAGDRARGATAVVTLEPCVHQGRTGPCAEALVDAGVERVVVALEDPDSRVSGRGFARLAEAGIEVVTEVGADEVARSLAPYLHHRRTGRSACLAKIATSVDGRAAAADGSSKWITGPGARADAHELRADSQAIVVGAGTALADQPRLTVRAEVTPAPIRPPVRVLVDGRGRVPATGPLFETRDAPTMVLTSDTAAPRVVDAWIAAGAKVEVLPAAPGGVALDAVLATLGSLGVLQAMVEGGPTLLGALLGAGLVDRMIVYVAPTVLGDRALPAVSGWSPPTLADAERFELRGVSTLGADVRLEYEVSR